MDSEALGNKAANSRVLITVTTGEYARRADFYDYYEQLKRPPNSFSARSHDRSPAYGRNMLIQAALDNNCTHILFIDDDMEYESDALFKLLEHDVDVVTGLYLGRAYPHQPLIFDLFDDEGQALYSYLTPEMGRLKPIKAAGFGFLLIKTHVFQTMEKPWVRLGELNPEQWCDDIGFFYRLHKAGFKAYCDMDCLCGHIGTVIIKPYRDEKGEWFTSYDTGGKGKINTPQIAPSVEYK